MNNICSYCKKAVKNESDYVQCTRTKICKICIKQAESIFSDNSEQIVLDSSCSICYPILVPENSFKFKLAKLNSGLKVCQSCVRNCKTSLQKDKCKPSSKHATCFICLCAEEFSNRLVAGPEVHICSSCISMCKTIVFEEKLPEEVIPNQICRFCGKKSEEVKVVLTFATTSICNECIEIADELRTDLTL